MVYEKKFYLTKGGLEKIKKEHDALKSLKLSKMRGESPKIWQSEDVNPEYLSFQEDMEFLGTRLSELDYILKNTEIIKKPGNEKKNKIDLGAKVLVEVEGQTDEFEIVGTLEANPALGRISNESPVGHALLGRCVGDMVTVQSSIKATYKILKIKYQQS